MSIDARPMVDGDIDSVVELFPKAFPNFFLTSMGPMFIRELEKSFVRDPMAVSVVAIDTESGQLQGFVGGTTCPKGHFKRLLKRRWWAFALASIPAVLRRPSIIPRLVRGMFYRGGGPEAGEGLALLSGVAVHPDAQGKGVGQIVMRAWLAEMRRRGVEGCYLVTDAVENERVNRYYQKSGLAPMCLRRL